MKTTVVAAGLQVAGMVLFTSSLFVKDNNKAVNRRWLSLALYAGGSLALMAQGKVA